MPGYIGQTAYLVWLTNGLARIANDPYDNLFHKLNRNSHEIWDDERQAFLRNVSPVPVHSHNDENRHIPLFEALGSGCVSVEADVHLKDNDLLVGHSAAGLHKDNNLRSMYLDPIKRILEMQNPTKATRRGVYNRDPDQTLVLLIDQKKAGQAPFDKLNELLQPLRDLDFLTYWDGNERIMRPLTVVASGMARFEYVMGLNATHRDIFLDAQLCCLYGIDDDYSKPTYQYNQSNSYFASTWFSNARLYSRNSHLKDKSPADLDMYGTDVDRAKARGLLTRYWDTPSEPSNVRDVAWRWLIDSGVDLINMDDLGIVRQRAKGWGSIRHMDNDAKPEEKDLK
ncbi:Altered inheritance of mitochondria protein 6 [Fusarium torreyae]|uniref:Altered inheritance of mitochondria protein 6 n=1 Tax=Fusarium torreyae TaxID=1237075 RepID=A0A9W8RLH8_9HYPO|nr:Altered inheritance of mitochondria protein 6 [Fusarium torreyae]